MIIPNNQTGNSHTILYAILAIGFIFYIASVLIMFKVINLSELSTNKVVRFFQITTNAVIFRKNIDQVTNEKIASDIRVNFPFSSQNKRTNNVSVYNYTYPSIKNLQSFGAVGYITRWDKKTYQLTITNIDKQNLIFELTPDSQRPIYETEIVPGTDVFVQGTDLNYHFCEFGDLVEVVWDDSRNVDEIISDSGKIKANNLSITRPFLIKFYNSKSECFK